METIGFLFLHINYLNIKGKKWNEADKYLKVIWIAWYLGETESKYEFFGIERKMFKVEINETK